MPATFCACSRSIAVDTPPGARDRGTVIHGAIGDYTEMFANNPPADPLKELLKLGEQHFAPLNDYPEARAFWWPRFERIARWFAAWDVDRRAGLTTLHAEIRGELTFTVGTREFTLSAHRRPHRAAQGRHATPSSTTRPAGAARRSRCVRGSRRN